MNDVHSSVQCANNVWRPIRARLSIDDNIARTHTPTNDEQLSNKCGLFENICI